MGRSSKDDCLGESCDEVREYIVDMLIQLARLAEQGGDRDLAVRIRAAVGASSDQAMLRVM